LGASRGHLSDSLIFLFQMLSKKKFGQRWLSPLEKNKPVRLCHFRLELDYLAVLLLLVVGATTFKKASRPKLATSFQIGSGWNFACMIFLRVNVHWLVESDLSIWRHTFEMAVMMSAHRSLQRPSAAR